MLVGPLRAHAWTIGNITIVIRILEVVTAVKVLSIFRSRHMLHSRWVLFVSWTSCGDSCFGLVSHPPSSVRHPGRLFLIVCLESRLLASFDPILDLSSRFILEDIWEKPQEGSGVSYICRGTRNVGPWD